MPDGTPCIAAGGYPWVYGACLNADDLNAAFNGNPGLFMPGRIAPWKRWVDLTPGDYAVQRYYDGAVAVPTGAFDIAAHQWLPQLAGGLTSIAIDGFGIADLGSVPENLIHLAGLGPLNGIGTSLPPGAAKFLRFDSGTSIPPSVALTLIGSAVTIVTQANDMAIAIALGGGNGLFVYLPVTPPTGGGTTPPVVVPPITINTPMTYPIADGVTRVYVNTSGLVTLTLPLNDCTILDRSGLRSSPIIVNPPAGKTINGLTAFSLVANWDVRNFLYDGTNYGLD